MQVAPSGWTWVHRSRLPMTHSALLQDESRLRDLTEALRRTIRARKGLRENPKQSVGKLLRTMTRNIGRGSSKKEASKVTPIDDSTAAEGSAPAAGGGVKESANGQEEAGPKKSVLALGLAAKAKAAAAAAASPSPATNAVPTPEQPVNSQFLKASLQATKGKEPAGPAW